MKAIAVYLFERFVTGNPVAEYDTPLSRGLTKCTAFFAHESERGRHDLMSGPSYLLSYGDDVTVAPRCRKGKVGEGYFVNHVDNDLAALSSRGPRVVVSHRH